MSRRILVRAAAVTFPPTVRQRDRVVCDNDRSVNRLSSSHRPPSGTQCPLNRLAVIQSGFPRSDAEIQTASAYNRDTARHDTVHTFG